MNAQKSKTRRAQRRSFRVRKSLTGTAKCPRLSIYRTNLNISAQLIDDANQVTLASATSLGKSSSVEKGGNVSGAVEVGKMIAEKAKSHGITEACFDRGPYRFHGRVKALARAATEAGLKCTSLEEKVKKVRAETDAPVKVKAAKKSKAPSKA